MPEYTVFFNRGDGHRGNGGDHTWTQHPASVEASGPTAAIDKLRAAEPELKADKGCRFFAIASFTPKRMRRQLVERWALDDADKPDDEPAQGTLGDA